MKAIFLDIDGVIATPTSVRDNYRQGRAADTQRYDALALRYLGRLVGETGAMVVLTSNWRRDADERDEWVSAIMDNLYAQLAEAGAPVSDQTPVLFGHDRSCEVGAWLAEHPCEAYVIIDDLAHFDERPDVAEGHLVIVEDSEGIRGPHFQRALDILTGSG